VFNKAVLRDIVLIYFIFFAVSTVSSIQLYNVNAAAIYKVFDTTIYKLTTVTEAATNHHLVEGYLFNLVDWMKGGGGGD